MKLTLSNFGLFKNTSIELGKINLFSGENSDGDKSSNGSGKSTIAKNALTFVLYGDVPSKSLKDLISFGEKECYVEFIDNNIRIRRSIPSALQIFQDEQEIEFNTIGLKEKWINEHYGDYSNFKTYRLIDLKGINLLDSLNDPRGITTLQKNLMNFSEDLFTQKRTSLLSKKNNCELYNKDKRLYKFSLSKDRLERLTCGVETSQLDKEVYQETVVVQQNAVNNIKAEIQARERNIYFKTKDLAELNKGYCPVLKITCNTVIEKANQVNINVQEEVHKLEVEIKELKSQLSDEEDLLIYHQDNYRKLVDRERKAKEYLMKLQEAFKFSNYSFTLKDVQNYTEAIKILDSFSSYYIENWLSQLELIINDILTPINLRVSFVGGKEFMKIQDKDQELTYNLLSSGQQTFLSSVFKLSILLQKGETTGLIICDEGLGNLDEKNLLKFIEVCKGLDFTFNIIYQDPPEMEGINQIKIVRENGISEVKNG